jgi:UDP-N-acetylmuramate dehydrogenase
VILHNISLKKYNTFGLDYKADCLVILKTEEEAVLFFRDRGSFAEPLLLLGEGSNILFTDDFKGTIVNPAIEGIKIEEQNKKYVIISAGAGLNWDKFVEWCINMDYGGIENLSLIPGTVGATPVQNIGAYGVEVKDTIQKVKAISVTNGKIREFTNEECRFGYRDSIFKNELKDKYLITSVFYRLAINPQFDISYGSLREEAKKSGSLSLKTVRQAVINIRRNKLPDPLQIGNAGSFYKNPVISIGEAQKLKEKFPDIPSCTDLSGGIKLAAGWLIEQCGWKGKRIGDAGVHEKQALILVNHGKATGKEIYDLSEKIRKSVYKKFGIILKREVEVVGTV